MEDIEAEFGPDVYSPQPQPVLISLPPFPLDDFFEAPDFVAVLMGQATYHTPIVRTPLSKPSANAQR